MRITTVIGAFIAGALAYLPPAMAAERDIAAGGGAAACGAGTCAFGFAVGASSGPLGENPQGHMSVDGRVCQGSPSTCVEFQVDAAVTCLAVVRFNPDIAFGHVQGRITRLTGDLPEEIGQPTHMAFELADVAASTGDVEGFSVFSERCRLSKRRSAKPGVFS